MGDKQVLMYKDIVLHDSDVDTLRGPCYLNDQVIVFYLSYLFSSNKMDDVLHVGPSISLCLANCEDNKFVEEFAESCKLSSKRLVLFVVNDIEDFDSNDGGNHWSILVYDRMSNSFLHYDSMTGVNSIAAMKLYDAIKGYMGPGGGVSTLQTSSSLQKKQRKKKKNVQAASKHLVNAKTESDAASTSTGLPVFVECKTPQQSNGYDCGLYVLAIAKAIYNWYRLDNYRGDLISAIKKRVDDSSVELNLRKEVLEIIEELAKE